MLANVIHWINLYTMVNAYSTRSVGVFFRREKVFVRESAMLKLQIRGGHEASQRGRERGREERRGREYFLPSPSPFLSFALAPNLRVTFLISSMSLCHEIENGGYNETNINKQLLTHALQARMIMEGD